MAPDRETIKQYDYEAECIEPDAVKTDSCAKHIKVEIPRINSIFQMSLSRKKKISVVRSKKLSQSPRGELSDSDTTSLARFRLKKSKPSILYAFDALKSQTIL